MSNVKVSYFNGRGLCETMRILLKYGNIDFEDIRIEKENWAEMKPTTPFGQMPLYEEDGKVLWQSTAIARYLAKKVKLAGENDWENLEIDAIVDTITDFRLKMVPFYMEEDAEKKEKIKQTLLTENIPYYLERLEKIVSQNNGYLAVNKLTWADIHFVSIIDLYKAMLGEELLEKYPNLTSLKKKVEEIPVIKSWIEARPETPF